MERKSIKNKRILVEEIITKNTKNIDVKTLYFYLEDDDELDEKQKNFCFCIGSSSEHILMFRDCDDITMLITNIFKTNLNGLNVYLLEDDLKQIFLKKKIEYSIIK